jgi:hypothetical protein
MGILAARRPTVRFLRLYLLLQLWNLLPNRRGAHFFDLWSGRRRADAFRRALREDLGELFGLLADGTLTAPIDSTYPLGEAAAALRRAEIGGATPSAIHDPDSRGPRPTVRTPFWRDSSAGRPRGDEGVATR